MNELSLFTGAGGGLLGTHHLLGFNCIGYVEWDDYCQRVIAARIRDGFIPAAPIFGDVREFAQSGAAREYRGFADVVSGGFPCQPFSSAARGRNNAEDLWPWMLRVVAEIKPQFVFAENVAGSSGIWDGVKRDLEIQGYAVSGPIRVGSSDVGGPDVGSRYWLLAKANSSRESVSAINDEAFRLPESCGAGEWWRTDPRALGMADGMAYRLDRLKAIGNGQVPAVARAAWQLLS